MKRLYLLLILILSFTTALSQTNPATFKEGIRVPGAQLQDFDEGDQRIAVLGQEDILGFIVNNFEDKKKLTFVEAATTTGATTAAKVASTVQGNYIPVKGDIVMLTLAVANTATNPTLNIDGSGAKPILLGGVNPTGVGSGGVKLLLFYDGAGYNMFGSNRTVDSNTRYQSYTTTTIRTDNASPITTNSSTFNICNNTNTLNLVTSNSSSHRAVGSKIGFYANSTGVVNVIPVGNSRIINNGILMDPGQAIALSPGEHLVLRIIDSTDSNMRYLVESYSGNLTPTLQTVTDNDNLTTTAFGYTKIGTKQALLLAEDTNNSLSVSFIDDNNVKSVDIVPPIHFGMPTLENSTHRLQNKSGMLAHTEDILDTFFQHNYASGNATIGDQFTMKTRRLIIEKDNATPSVFTFSDTSIFLPIMQGCETVVIGNDNLTLGGLLRTFDGENISTFPLGKRVAHLIFRDGRWQIVNVYEEGSGGGLPPAGSVTNSMLANVPGYSVKAKPTSGSGAPTDLVISTNSLLGRGTGNIVPITLGSNLSISGNTLNATGPFQDLDNVLGVGYQAMNRPFELLYNEGRQSVTVDEYGILKVSDNVNYVFTTQEPDRIRFYERDTYHQVMPVSTKDNRTHYLQDKDGTLAHLDDIDTALGEYVPLSGTEVGKPLTGNIVVDASNDRVGFITETENRFIGITEDGLNALRASDSYDYSHLEQNPGLVELYTRNNNNQFSRIQTNPTSILLRNMNNQYNQGYSGELSINNYQFRFDSKGEHGNEFDGSLWYSAEEGLYVQNNYGGNINLTPSGLSGYYNTKTYTLSKNANDAGASRLLFPDSGNTQRRIPVSVNGNYANQQGEIMDLPNIIKPTGPQSYLNFPHAETIILNENGVATMNLPNPTTHTGKKIRIKTNVALSVGISGGGVQGFVNEVFDLMSSINLGGTSNPKNVLLVSDGTSWHSLPN